MKGQWRGPRLTSLTCACHKRAHLNCVWISVVKLKLWQGLLVPHWVAQFCVSAHNRAPQVDVTKKGR